MSTQSPCSLAPVILLFIVTLAIMAFSTVAQTKHTTLSPLVIELNMNSADYQEVLGGPPKTVGMESGLVVLATSKTGQKHSTKKYEEVLVIFAGTGEMRITGGQSLKLKPHVVAYCPPLTEHYIANTGATPLRYLYVAAKSQP